MKSATLAVFGAFGLLVLTGPVHQMQAPQPVVAKADLPMWLNVPPSGEVSTAAVNGSQGIVDVSVDGDGDDAMAAMKSILAAKGFQLEDRLTSVDSLFGASGFVAAVDPVTGRHMQVVKLDQPGRATFRISFENPSPELAQVF